MRTSTSKIEAVGPMEYFPTLFVGMMEMINALNPMATTEICKLSVLAYLSPIKPNMNPPSGLAKKATANTPYTFRISSSLPPVKKDFEISALKLAKTPVVVVVVKEVIHWR
jgi:hypothetical protein